MRMTSAKIEHSHPPVKHGKVGVLLVNLGTPDGTDYASMRCYLKEFRKRQGEGFMENTWTQPF